MALGIWQCVLKSNSIRPQGNFRFFDRDQVFAIVAHAFESLPRYQVAYFEHDFSQPYDVLVHSSAVVAVQVAVIEENVDVKFVSFVYIRYLVAI